MSALTADPLAPLLDVPGVAEAVDSARVSVDRLLAHRVLRRQSAAVTGEGILRGARASAALDGVEVPLAAVRNGTTTEPTVQGALRTCLAVAELASVWRRAPLQALARLHLLAAGGQQPESRLGRPTADAAVSARLESLARLVAGASQAPAAILTAVVHGELLTLQPFGVADGIVARAAMRLTMVSRGLDPKMVSVPELGHLQLRTEYAEALASYTSGTAEGVGSWIRHCCAAIALGAQEGLAICEAILRG